MTTRQRHHLTALISVVAVGTLTLSACSSDPAASTTPSAATSSATSSANAPAATSSAPPAAAAPGPDADLATTTFAVDLDQALAVADTTAPSGTITKIELDFDRAANTWVWKIDSQQNTDQHEMKIDATTARVLADDRDQESANPVAVDATTLTPKDAEARATALVPGSVAKWALEFDDGVQRYAFDIRTSPSDTQGVIVDVDSGTATKKD